MHGGILPNLPSKMVYLCDQVFASVSYAVYDELRIDYLRHKAVIQRVVEGVHLSSTVLRRMALLGLETPRGTQRRHALFAVV